LPPARACAIAWARVCGVCCQPRGRSLLLRPEGKAKAASRSASQVSCSAGVGALTVGLESGIIGVTKISFMAKRFCRTPVRTRCFCVSREKNKERRQRGGQPGRRSCYANKCYQL